jgi:AraC-like DNA-binding protein
MLSLNSRTLRRRLRLVGTTYQSLLDETRFSEARRYLLSTRHTVESIATSLGYADARSFRTAFKRWSGRTPFEFRHGQGLSGAIRPGKAGPGRRPDN